MSLVDNLRKKSRVKWTTLRGEKVGLKILTRNEMKDFRARMASIEDAETSEDDDLGASHERTHRDFDSPH